MAGLLEITPLERVADVPRVLGGEKLVLAFVGYSLAYSYATGSEAHRTTDLFD